MHIHIIANGTVSDPDGLRKSLERAAMVIAVDGGAAHCDDIGIRPDAIIGDMDSLSERTVDKYREQGIEIKLHPVEKNATDLELAMDYALDKNPADVSVWGAFGNRWDMSISNIMLMTREKYRDMKIVMEDEHQKARILKPNQVNHITGVEGAKVSLIPLCEDVMEVTTTGLAYPLHAETLCFGQTRGISNVFQKAQATVQYSNGILLCVVFKGRKEL